MNRVSMDERPRRREYTGAVQGRRPGANASAGSLSVSRGFARRAAMIPFDQAWLATAPPDMRAGITCGLYSGGHSLAPIKEACEKFRYPGINQEA